MIVAYIRVSTTMQTVEAQEFGILRYAAKRKMVVDEIVEETVSGAKSYKKRKLGLLLEQLQPKDSLIVSELTRLGRSMMEVMEILNHCLSYEIQLHSIKEKLVFDDSINSKVMAFCFSLSGEIERKMIADRTRESLEQRKASGVKLGRPKGSTSASMLDGREDEIVELLRKDVSKASIARIMGCAPGTLGAFIITRNLVDKVEMEEEQYVRAVGL